MSRVLVLDAEALSTLARGQGQQFARARAALDAARALGRAVVVPATVLAELYRGPGHNHLVDACLSRETAIGVRDTDRSLARLVGSVLAAADAGTEDLVDAHCVAVAVEWGGGVVLTGDVDDLERLAACYQGLAVVGL